MSDPKTVQEAVERRAQALEQMFNLDADMASATPSRREELRIQREHLAQEISHMKRYLYSTRDQPDDITLHRKSLEIFRQLHSEGVEIDPAELAHIEMLEKRIARG